MKKYFKILFVVGLSLTVFQSCANEDLEPTLAQSKDTEAGIQNSEDLRAVLIGGYDRMSHYFYYGRDYVIFGEVRSDNTFADGNSNRFVGPAQFELLPTQAYVSDTWSQIYKVIGSANIVINKDENALSGDKLLIQHTKAEALAIRALAHFDLLKLYGQYQVDKNMTALGVPYVTKFKDADFIYPKRSTVQENYNSIIGDLNEALSLIPESLDDYSAHYINKNVINALKARVALHFGDYPTAATSAKLVIDSGKYSIASKTDIAKTFFTDSTSNQIFSIAQQSNKNSGINGLNNIYALGSYGDVVALKNLYDLYESTDVRKAFLKADTKNTGAYRNIGKYPTRTYDDDIPVIRYEEVVLIYAESLLSSNPSEALVWLNKIPAARGASVYTSANIANVLSERRKEFAFEGQRFWDLLRTGNAIPFVDTRQTFKATIPYGDTKLAFPIPSAELGANANVVQNKGYSTN